MARIRQILTINQIGSLKLSFIEVAESRWPKNVAIGGDKKPGERFAAGLIGERRLASRSRSVYLG
jgi:hypothetical protein